MKKSLKKIVILGIGNIGFNLVKELGTSQLQLEIIVISRRLPSYFKAYLKKHTNLKIDFIEADITNKTDLEQIRTNEKLQNINVLVSTIGQQDKLNDFVSYKNTFDENFFGNVTPIKALIENIPKNSNNRIIIISSTSGNKAPNFINAYAPSKFALENFSSALQQELARNKIYVDIIRPTNIINEYSQSFKTKRGIPASRAVSKIVKQIRFLYNNRSKPGIKSFIPYYFLSVRILERVFPGILNRIFKLKPGFVRRKSYKDLPIKRILITGGSSGLGRELAFLYSKLADEITITGRNADKLKNVQEEIEKKSKCKISIVTVNFESIDDVLTLSKQSKEFDLLINNAGQHLNKSVIDTSLEEYEHIINTNFLSVVALTQSQLKSDNLKKVVNILSSTAICGRKNLSAYSASKSALWAYTRSFRRQYGNKIHTMEVIPSTFQSSLFRRSNDKNASKNNLLDSMEVARRVFKAERSGRDILYISYKVRLYLLLESLFYPLFKKMYLK
jgi:short-subunit dehydrogenase